MNGVNLGMASLADTGQWLLVVEISAAGISAILKNVDYDDTPTMQIFQKDWNESAENLLSNIESAVYDNPRILEDFATKVIIRSDKALWIPADLTEDEEFDDRYFTCVYPAEAEDIAADFGEEEVCLYTLVPGLNSFINRTLPGSRIFSHLSVLKTAFQKFRDTRDESSPRSNELFINIRPGFADIFAFSEGRFLNGATHIWNGTPDIVYKALLVTHAYGIPTTETSCHIICGDAERKEIDTLLSEFFPELISLGIEGMEESMAASVISCLAAGHELKRIE